MSENTSTADAYSFSLRPQHISFLKDIAKQHNITTRSETIQFLIEDYQKRKCNKRRDAFIYLVIPGLFWLFSFYTFYSLQGLEDILFLQDLYFNELHILKLVYLVITFLFISIFAVAIYLVYNKYKHIFEG